MRNNRPAGWEYTLVAAIFAAFLALFVVLGTEPAHATRPVPGVVYPDLCKNRGPWAMPGVQNVFGKIRGQWEFVNPNSPGNHLGRHNCRPGWRFQ